MIFFYSGTGNSAYVARRLSEDCGEPLLSLNDKIRAGDNTAPEAEKLVFSVPTNAWRIPRLVEAWIENTPLPAGAPAWFVMTCGSEIGAAGHYLRRLCERKGLNYMGVAQIIMPENYIAMFDAPGRDEALEIIRAAEPSITDAAACIARGSAFPPHPVGWKDRVLSGPVNPVFHAFFVRDAAFKADARCISCGKCALLCPVNNIRLKDGKPVWGGRCVHCMACICSCPTGAIEYGKKSLGQPRYTCPL